MPDTSLIPYVNILSIDIQQSYEVNIIVFLNSKQKTEAEKSWITYLTSPLCEVVPIPVCS